jgi:hypothetical protein
MHQDDRLHRARLSTIEAEFRPFAWRQMTVRAVAVRLVQAIEREDVQADDGRVWMVEQALSACHWRGLTTEGVARQAAAALEVWHVSRQRLDVELAWLLAIDA